MFGYNTDKDLIVTEFEIVSDEIVLVTFKDIGVKKMNIFHWNKSNKSILCDDFSTYITY